MDQNSIISKKNFEVFEHEEDHPDVFICDKQIAPAVALLNKKGYKTFASCSGHYKIEFYEYFNEDINKLEDYKNNDRVIIKQIRDNSFDYWEEVDFTGIYILFMKKYNFNSLPANFYYDNDDTRTCIRCKISYYDGNIRKSRESIIKEIEFNHKKLIDWVNQLPINK